MPLISMKKLYLTLALLSAFAAQASEWIADSTTQCKVWNPFPKPEEAIKWTGDCKDGKAAGLGTLEWFKEGKPNGTSHGSYIEGKRLSPSKGSTSWANGNRYEGDFLDDKRTGKGNFTWLNGTRYEGDFIEGKLTGKGTMTWPSGNRYEGDFVDGKRTGKGIFVWPNGDRYEGDFVDGNLSGKGTHISARGRYEGDWLNNKQHGKGSFTWLNGYAHANEWVDGKPKY
jgi:hypothetical protein